MDMDMSSQTTAAMATIPSSTASAALGGMDMGGMGSPGACKISVRDGLSGLV